METAGLRWQPEMCPMANAIVRTVRPNASDTPSSPIPTSGKAAASTALPQPPRTSQKVPMNSAESFASMAHLNVECECPGHARPQRQDRDHITCERTYPFVLPELGRRRSNSV